MDTFRQAHWRLAWRYFLINLASLLLFSAFIAVAFRSFEHNELRRQLARQAGWLSHAPNVPPDLEEMREELNEISIGSDHPLGFVITSANGQTVCRVGFLGDSPVPDSLSRTLQDQPISTKLAGERCFVVVVKPNSAAWSRALIAISAEDAIRGSNSLSLLLLGSTALAALLLFALGCHLSTRTLRPVQQSYRAMQKSLADASHELRTPLTAIMGEAEVALRQQREPEAYRETLTYCAAYARQMLAVVEGVLELSRADADIPIVDAHLLDLGEIVLSEVENLRRQLPQGPTIEATADRQTIVYGDGDLLARALRNLLDNAVRHTPSEGRIQIEVSQSVNGKTALLSVTDTGAGISATDLPHIFDRFYQGSNLGLNGSIGSGLGLAIVKALVEAHQGSVQVTSEVGVGTSFLVTLPVPAQRDRHLLA